MKKIPLTETTAKQLTRKAFEETNRFYKEHISRSKDTLTIVLKTHLFVESIIDEILKGLFPAPKEIIKKRFITKIELLEAFDLELFHRVSVKIRALNNIRNKFAHDLDYKLTSNDLAPLAKDLELVNSSKKIDKLKRGSSYIIGYLMGLKTAHEAVPFLMACLRNKKLYQKDCGYILKDILANYKENQLGSFFKALEYKIRNQ